MPQVSQSRTWACPETAHPSGAHPSSEVAGQPGALQQPAKSCLRNFCVSCIPPPGRGSCRWAPESLSGSACMVQVPEGTLASCSCCSAAVYLNHPVLVADMNRNAAGMGGRVRFAGQGQILSLLKPSARMWQLEASCISRQPST